MNGVYKDVTYLWQLLDTGIPSVASHFGQLGLLPVT
jgi:hypothetical protein